MCDVDWDERYRGNEEQRPWDTGIPERELQRCVERLEVKPKRAVEIGCGTGTNAIWLAEQGIEVIATDLSPTAIDAAQARIKQEKLPIEFRVGDISQNAPTKPQWADFAFDRGVFHVMQGHDARVMFAERVAESLAPGGYWLCMAGSADETKSAEAGPPRLKASELALATEAHFELHSLTRGHFGLPDKVEYLAWVALLRKRTV